MSRSCKLCINIEEIFVCKDNWDVSLIKRLLNDSDQGFILTKSPFFNGEKNQLELYSPQGI